MPSLDAPAWSDLRHAYGSASDIPALLKQLATDTAPKKPGEGPWHSLWSALCHQGDVFDGSYAAVEHIVSTAARATGPLAWDFFMLPASIEVARCRFRGPALQSDLTEGYFGALRELHGIAFARRELPWDRYMMRSVLAAIAAAKGDIDLAEVLMELDDSGIARMTSERFRTGEASH